jgi:hypothetical protein
MPMQLDFRALQDGVIRNNVGVDRIVVAFAAATAEGQVRAIATGQRWPLRQGADLGDDAGAISWLCVEGLTAEGPVQLRLLAQSHSLAQRPQGLPERSKSP